MSRNRRRKIQPGDPDQMLRKMADEFCHRIMEYGADSITVAITRVSHKGTHRCVRGQGNIYARRGILKEYLVESDELDRIAVRQNDE